MKNVFGTLHSERDSDSQDSKSKVCKEKFLGQEGWVRLMLNLERQQMGHWCWAAIGQCLGEFYFGKRLLQRDLAVKTIGIHENQESPKSFMPEYYNQDQTLDRVLSLVGCYNRWTAGKPSFGQIQHEIMLGQPICARLQWYGGGAHYVIVSGFRAHDNSLLIEDPQTGMHNEAFNFFPGEYRTYGAIWTETYWTKPC